MRKMHGSKGQAALEFLTTYGWAFLVILVMIGALSYFGVLDPSRFLPDKCIFGTGIGACIDAVASDGAEDINATFINSFGKDLTVSAVNITVQGVQDATCTSAKTCAVPSNSLCNLPALWQSNSKAEFFLPCILTAGDKPKIHVTITYKESGGSYTKQVEGDIQVKLSP